MEHFSNRDRAMIKSIEVIRIGVPFETGGPRRGIRPGLAPWLINESLIVCVHTDDGLEGWGEGFGHFCNPGTEALLKNLIAPWFVGQDETGPAPVMDAAHRAFFGFGRQGPCMYALSAIDIALWDLAAKRAGKPLYQLLGGPPGDVEVTRYASLMSYGGDVDAVARNTERAADLGFSMVKLHERAMSPFLAAREAAPAQVAITLDVNCPWNVEEARRMARDLKARADVNGGFLWLEEPVWPPEDFAGLGEVRSEGVAISGGENIGSVTEFRHAVDLGAFDILQPSVAKIGGVSVATEIFALAQQAGLRCVPHAFYWGPGQVATAHLLAARADPVDGATDWLETAFIEYEETPHDLLDPFDPRLVLSADRPGLGFDLDRDRLERFEISRTRVS